MGVREVNAYQTRSGNTRYVLVDEEGGSRLGGGDRGRAWPVGGDPKRKVPPDRLFETLKPFKDRVAEDIKD